MFYYRKHGRDQDENRLKEKIREVFNKNRRVFGTRKIKVKLTDEGIVASRARIGRLMKGMGLVSVYNTMKYKSSHASCNEQHIANIVDRNFAVGQAKTVLVSDLTYVRVGKRWMYLCTIVNIATRQIVGYSAGEHKNADLVEKAFAKISMSLFEAELFHTDRGREFDNKKIDDLLSVFSIKRSLSKKGCPYDNAVAEALYKIIKTEFVRNRVFGTLQQLQVEFYDYIHWYNAKRIHGSLNYMTPLEFKDAP